MRLIEKMAAILKKEHLKLAAEQLDYSKTYKELYLNEDGSPDHAAIMGDLLGSAKEVKKEKSVETFYEDKEVGHSFSGSITNGSFVFEVPLNKVLVEEYEDQLDGLYEYSQTKEAEELIEEDIKMTIQDEISTDSFDSFSISFDFDIDKKTATFECKYVVTEKEE